MSIDRAISEHILLALRDLEESGKPLMGKRNITLFLQGKVNANSLELELHLQPGWGTLPFICIRKLQSILEGMIEVGIIEIYESPKKGFPVLRASQDSSVEKFSLQNVFPLDSDLDLTDQELRLFRFLRKERAWIAKNTGVIFTKLIPDKTLVRIAKNKPKDIDELRSIIGLGKMRAEYSGFIQKIANFDFEGEVKTEDLGGDNADAINQPHGDDGAPEGEKLEKALHELNKLMKEVRAEDE